MFKSHLAESYEQFAEECLLELQFIPRWRMFKRSAIRLRRREYLLHAQGHRELDALMERTQHLSRDD